MDRWIGRCYNSLRTGRSVFAEWRVLVYVAALTIFAVLMGAFAPTLVNLYLQYSKETVAPEIVYNHPYLVPVVAILALLSLSGAWVVYAAIREHHNKKK